MERERKRKRRKMRRKSERKGNRITGAEAERGISGKHGGQKMEQQQDRKIVEDREGRDNGA